MKNSDLILKIKNLYKTYKDGTKALKNISFNVTKGDFLVIIGLSGSGKSTLLRCINRLIETDSGQIIFKNKNICLMNNNELSETRKKIGMVIYCVL